MIVLHEPDETDSVPYQTPGLGFFMYLFSGAVSSLHDSWHEKSRLFRNCLPTAHCPHSYLERMPWFLITKNGPLMYMDPLLILLFMDLMAFYHVQYPTALFYRFQPYSEKETR